MTVKQAVVQSIAVTPVNPSILSISSTVFKATGTYSDGTVADISNSVTWSSSQPGIATIAAGGAAATLAQGTTLIAATLDGTIGATNLKVTGGNLTGNRRRSGRHQAGQWNFRAHDRHRDFQQWLIP